MQTLAEMKKSPVAFVPLRAQPLHYGHINLLLSVAQSYQQIVVLLSQKKGDDDPYDYALRKQWLEQAMALYHINGHVEALPLFPSSIDSYKDKDDIVAIQKKFQALAHWSSFVIVSGNPKVIEVCQHMYDFDCQHVGDDFPIRWLLDSPNHFEKWYESYGATLRQLIADQSFDRLPSLLPSFVFNDIVSDLQN